MECGGGTGIFLVVTSTYIIVIRGRRACLWGSLYLDDYDEEDRDLKSVLPPPLTIFQMVLQTDNNATNPHIICNGPSSRKQFVSY